MMNYNLHKSTDAHRGKKWMNLNIKRVSSFDENRTRMQKGWAIPLVLTTEHVTMAADVYIQVNPHLNEAASIINQNGNQTT